MRYIISLSGGIASAASAIIAHRLKLDYELVFADTLIEDEDLYRFITEISEKLKKPLVHLKDGRTPWEVFQDVRYIGNSRTAHCSAVLKTDQVRKWLDTNAGPEDILVLGMYLDEEDRLERAAAKWAPRAVTSLLIENDIFPGRASQLVEELGVAAPKLYSLGFPHNNCGGMCVRAGQGQFATLLARKPETYRQHEQAMEDTMAAIGPTARPFIRVTRDRKIDYLTMKEFRERVEDGSLKPDLYEMGGCGCFVDDDPGAVCPLPDKKAA